jgi:hypothetical protein
MCEKKARLNSEILSFFSGFEGGSVQDSYGAKRANTLLQQECTCSGSISCHCLLNFLLDTYGYPVCALRIFKIYLVCHNKDSMFPSRRSSCKKSMVNKLLCKRSVFIKLLLVAAQLIWSWWYSIMCHVVDNGYNNNNNFIYIIT